MYRHSLTLPALFLALAFVLPGSARSLAGEGASFSDTAALIVSDIFPIETFSLENGLSIAVVPNHRAPVVHVMLWYKVGAADEPPGQSGLAHFLEHLMFKGTPTVPDGHFSHLVRLYGGHDNAMTTPDATAYFETVAPDYLDVVLRLEADRMVNLTLDPETVLTERDVILEERNERVEMRPASRLGIRLDAAFYLRHPYRIPVIGWRREIESLEVDDVIRFYRQWYAPNNAILVVAGDVKPDTVRRLAEKHFGPLPARDLPNRDRPTEPPQEGEIRVQLADPQVARPSWQRHYHAPSDGWSPSDVWGESQHSDSLRVLADILDADGGHLYTELTRKQELSLAVAASYSGTPMDMGSFSFYIIPRPGIGLATVEEAFEKLLAEILEKGVTPDEVFKAQQRMIDAAVFARDELKTPAYIVGKSLANGRPADHIRRWPQRIASVTPDSVLAAARAVLGPQRGYVTGELLPAAKPAPQEPSPQEPSPQEPSPQEPSLGPLRPKQSSSAGAPTRAATTLAEPPHSGS